MTNTHSLPCRQCSHSHNDARAAPVGSWVVWAVDDLSAGGGEQRTEDSSQSANQELPQGLITD